MKNSLFILVTILLLVWLTTATAGRSVHHTGDSFIDYAEVTRVQPLRRVSGTHKPTEACRPIRHSERERNSVRSEDAALGLIVGGAVGGALGHNLAHGSDAARVAGALIGSAAGYEAVRESYHREGYSPSLNAPASVSRERCQRVREFEKKPHKTRYRVSYRYHGKHYVTLMDHRPGKRIKVRVRIEPMTD